MRRFPDELKTEIAAASKVQGAISALEELLSGGYNVLPTGELYFIKELVARINGLNIYVYANDHPPPHFHILGGGIDAVFAIEDCRLLRGEISSRHHGLVGWWHREAKGLLEDAWSRNQLNS